MKNVRTMTDTELVTTTIRLDSLDNNTLSEELDLYICELHHEIDERDIIDLFIKKKNNS